MIFVSGSFFYIFMFVCFMVVHYPVFGMDNVINEKPRGNAIKQRTTAVIKLLDRARQLIKSNSIYFTDPSRYTKRVRGVLQELQNTDVDYESDSRVELLWSAIGHKKYEIVLLLLRKDIDLERQYSLLVHYSEALLSSRDCKIIEPFLNFIEQPGNSYTPYLAKLVIKLIQVGASQHDIKNYEKHLGVLLSIIDDVHQDDNTWVYSTGIAQCAEKLQNKTVVDLLRQYNPNINPIDITDNIDQ